MKKSAIIICGPTGVGKTAVGITIAKYYGTEIISADSRQCFKELNIGVARPSPGELAAVPHHFIASHSVKDVVNAAVFEKFALDKATEIFGKKDVVILVGGTGLYIKAFCEGLDEVPVVPGPLRDQIIKSYEQKGITWLQEELSRKDPVFYEQGEIMNPQRLMRALEVFEATGQSITAYRQGSKASRDFRIIKIGLELPKEQLHRNINMRVDAMMEKGLLQEVKELLPLRNLNALQTVGYSELFDYLDGRISLPGAVEEIKKNTRQYAKRQMTWFRKDKEIRWINVESGFQITDL